MKKVLILFYGLLLSTILSGQTFDKKYFVKSEWFSNNKDSCFYINDTLKLIKHSNLAPQWATKASNQTEYAEFEMKYLGTGDFVEFGFTSNKKIHLSWRQHNSMHIVPAGPWTWTFDEKTNIVSFYSYDKKSVFAFRPIAERKVAIESRFAEHKDLLTTTELTVIRIK